MKILWLDINASYSHSSLALPALHSQTEACSRELFDWCVVSGTINREPSSSLNEVISHKPDVILSTLWLFNHNYTIRLLSRISALLPNTKIILGGPEFLGNNESFLYSNKFITAVFRGEGEAQINNLLKALCGQKKLTEIDGICMLDNTSRYIDNGCAVVSSFNKLSPPENSEFFRWDKAFIQIETSRGCFNRCSFCVSGNGRKIEKVDYSNLRQRLDTAKARGIKEIRILDRTFNSDYKYAIGLLDIFSEYYPAIKFHLEIHPAFINNHLKRRLETLPDGLLFLEAGIQSLREDVLEGCNRSGSCDKALEGLKYLCSLGKFKVHADLIIGLPHYYYKQLTEDIATLGLLGVDEIQVEKLKLLPGTKMRRDAVDLKIVYADDPPYEVLQTSCMSYSDIFDASVLSKILDNWYNDPVWHTSFREGIKRHSDFIETILLFCQKNLVLNSPLSIIKKGTFLNDFCKKYYPDISPFISEAWEKAGFSPHKGAGKFARDT
ncbi:MAG: DUF4080 domain-containing protein [Bacteroidales bacterium]|nr:DUF4080 domain-containing protein [Bacteroidales bacterium]